MSSTDPETGFVTRNSQTAEEYAIDQAKARMAARRAEPAPEQEWGNVGQGAGRGTVDESFTVANLNNFTFWTEHRDQILEAARKQELPGQANSAAGPNDN
jgi:hypothetical protein